MKELYHEKVINENKKLKLSDLDKSCINTFEYLNLHHKINYIKIKAIFKEDDKEKIEVFFDNTSKNAHIIQKLKFRQNINSEILFEFYGNEDEDSNYMKEHIETIDFSLQIFSQSIFSKYMEKTIDELSLIDHVTGIYNRVYLDSYANKILSLANREHKKIAFVKVAIDQFKAVIDEFDYAIGDKVLKSLADVLVSTIRESDLVIKITHDEFLVILLNIENDENSITISNKLINNFAKKETVVNDNTKQTLKKTICCGVTVYPDDDTKIEELLKKADIALYEAQNMGRSKVFKFSEETTQTIDLF